MVAYDTIAPMSLLDGDVGVVIDNLVALVASIIRIDIHVGIQAHLSKWCSTAYPKMATITVINEMIRMAAARGIEVVKATSN